jgi:hypothetical protein
MINELTTSLNLCIQISGRFFHSSLLIWVGMKSIPVRFHINHINCNFSVLLLSESSPYLSCLDVFWCCDRQGFCNEHGNPSALVRKKFHSTPLTYIGVSIPHLPHTCTHFMIVAFDVRRRILSHEGSFQRSAGIWFCNDSWLGLLENFIESKSFWF